MMRAVSPRVLAVLGALALFWEVTPARAHVEAVPAFLPSGEAASIDFLGPNERDEPMTGFSITVPPGLVIEHAHPVDGWSASIEGSTATWTGGSLAPNAEIRFGATLAAESEPGSVDVTALQSYADGASKSWPVLLTVLPGSESPSRDVTPALVVALVGVLLVAALALLLWRRRVRDEP